MNEILKRDPSVLAKYGNKSGTDKPFLIWLKFQPCQRCGKVPRWEMSTFLYSMPCHARAVNKGAGTGIKPPWNAWSGCVECHKDEHQGKVPIELQQKWADEALLSYVYHKEVGCKSVKR